MRKAAIAMALFALSLCAGTALAQEPADVLKVDYFDNANTTGAPDGRLRLTNPGTAGASVCASIFVSNDLQELMECCSCILAPNGLRKLSVNKDLTSNPLNGVVLTTGSIEIVSSAPVSGVCPAPTKMKPVAALRAWVTHIQDDTFAVTETASQSAELSTDELNILNNECEGIQLNSHGGTCTCGTGD